jgi:predicted phosphohydrolase
MENPLQTLNAQSGGHESGRRIFALADPHLSLAGVKPMHVFGPRWDNHVAKLRDNWLVSVRPGDIVLMPGDISWGMRLEEALPDLEWIAALPGVKVLLKGNHDYWWQSIGKLRALGLPGMHFVQNDALLLDSVAVAGTRLWDFPGIHWGYISNRDNEDVAEEKRSAPKKIREDDPEKVRARELERLRLSLSKLDKNAALRICMLHFPPVGEDGGETEITRIIGEYAPDICVFGHVHALVDRPHAGADVVIGGVRYVLAASDFLGHAPKGVAEV